MFDYVIVGTFTSVVLCRCGKIFKVLTGDGYQVFSIILFLKNGGKFCCGDFGMIICWYWRFVVKGRLRPNIFFCFVCTSQDGHFFLLLFLSLGKYKKTNVEWVEAAVVCSRKVQWKEWQTFFSTFKSLCWETRARLIIKVILC